MQIKLNEKQRKALWSKIEDDYTAALSRHQRRIDRWTRYYQLWRNRVDPPVAGEDDISNIRVPLIQWSVFAKWASEVDSLLGPDAEVLAEPVGPADHRITKKVSLFEKWRLFHSMKITHPLAVFIFRKILFGRAFAYAPYHEEKYPILGQGGKVEEATWYAGPGFFPIWPDDLVVPAADSRTIHDFPWVVRKFRATPDQLLRGERNGKYAGVKENLKQIEQWAETSEEREFGDQPIQAEKDIGEGVLYQGFDDSSGTIRVWEYYGKRTRRGSDWPEEFVCHYLPDMSMDIGIQSLLHLYPKARCRRPIVESALVKDGSYWPMGFGEILEMYEEELTVNENLFTEAGQFSVGPVIFYSPASGFKDDSIRYQPFQMIPAADTGNIKVVDVRANPEFYVLKNQQTLATVERITGQSDFTMGRGIDRPTSPKTASGQAMLLDQGNVRAALDMTMLREDLSDIIQHLWMIDVQFSDESLFFRVTEEEAGGLFDVRNGHAEMTPEEFGGRYDFRIKFATSRLNKEIEKQNTLALYQLDLQNPLVAMNPRALWMITNRVHEAMGDPNFADLVPEPPDLGQPKNPKEEWTLLLQGEPVDVHPMDNDDLHLKDHLLRAQQAQFDPKRDQPALQALLDHVQAHVQQRQQKKLMQAMVTQLADSLAQQSANPDMGGLNANPAIPLGIQQLQAQLGTVAAPAAAPGGGSPPGKPNGSM